MKVKTTIVQTHRAYSLHLEMWEIKELLSVWLLTFPFSEAPNKVPCANEYRFWLLDYTDYFLSSSSPLNNCFLWNPLCKKHVTLQHSYFSFVFNITVLSVVIYNMGNATGQGYEVAAKNAGRSTIEVNTEYPGEKRLHGKWFKGKHSFLYQILVDFQKPRNSWLYTGQDINLGTTGH